MRGIEIGMHMQIDKDAILRKFGSCRAHQPDLLFKILGVHNVEL